MTRDPDEAARVAAQFSTKWLDKWADLQWMDALWGPFNEVMGQSVVALFLSLGMFVPLYVWSRSITLPAVVLTLLGGVILYAVPGTVATMGWLVIVLAATLGLFALVWRAIR